MYVIGDTPEDNRLAVEVFQNATQIKMKLAAHARFAQKGAPLFGGEHRVD